MMPTRSARWRWARRWRKPPFRRDVRHFAYPFGDRDSWRRQHVAMAQEAGYVSAASALPGIVEARGRGNLYALPRLAWDGRQRSLRMMRVLLSGAFFAQTGAFFAQKRVKKDNWS
jgi:hypothetical protein